MHAEFIENILDRVDQFAADAEEQHGAELLIDAAAENQFDAEGVRRVRKFERRTRRPSNRRPFSHGLPLLLRARRRRWRTT